MNPAQAQDIDAELYQRGIIEEARAALPLAPWKSSSRPATIGRFHQSQAFYRGVMGPVRGGKSTGMCWEIMSKAQAQAPGKDGVRRTRWVVVRSTYRELLDTTIKTWQDWFRPEQFGSLNMNTMSHMVDVRLPDKTRVQCEVLFRALDRPDDVRKLLSMEVTGAWVNEARETPKGVIDVLGDRVGQYPALKDGGCTWRGVFMDTNPPDDDHWWYKLAEEVRPDGWEFFKQPGGLMEVDGQFINNPLAENVQNLEPNYYLTRTAGKDSDYIRVYYCNQYGFIKEGKPVYPEYIDAVHCSERVLEPVKGVPIYVGLDFGLTPAATFAQRLPIGRWQVFDELVTEDMGAVNFAKILKAKMLGEYGGFEFEVWGDPSGDSRAQTDEVTPFQIMRANGVPARPAPSNDPVLRREAVVASMKALAMDGKPGFLISPKCRILRKGMAGGYYYKRVQVAGDARFQDKAEKNKFSHVCFIAGTKISTPIGPKAIEALEIGDMVNTPYGPKPVTNIGDRFAKLLIYF
ncbi:MAG: hypothetical protein D4R73_09425 [Deltaproteobacteria bacterium]|nr:MAG: hypothetical protein D4R73_09425 [Deltaproteobacteria bacterium]